jgi:uncharacterized protein (TIGR00299 family) protein
VKIAYFDCAFGAAGDMLVAACLDLGARQMESQDKLDLAYLLSQLALLNLPPQTFSLALSRVERCSIAAAKFEVALHLEDLSAPEDHHEHDHSHTHDEHERGHSHHHQGHGPRRPLFEILEIIKNSALNAHVKEMATAIFINLGEAESKVHGVPLAEIHFHEVGSVDAIVDIVGFAIAYDKLAVEAAYVSPLPLGSGMVNTAHGRFPVPGPAVLNLLAAAGAPVSAQHFQYECLTPTGAAILATIACGWGENPAFQHIDGIGYGAGSLNPSGHPNVVRILLGEAAQPTPAAGERKNGAAEPQFDQFRSEIVAVVETNLDDCSPQILAHTMELLLEKGALDVAVSPLTMKKSRPGHKLSVICRVGDRALMQKLILRETTSLGVRSYQCERLVQEREFQEITLGDGPAIRIKVGRNENGQVINVHPEYEDLAKYARLSGVSLKDVLQKSLLKVLGEDAVK